MAVTIRHIVFDIGMVLIRWNPELPYLHLIPDAGERSWFLENVCTPEWNAEQDRGRPWPEAEALLIDRFPEHAGMIRAYRQHWHEMVPGRIEGTAAILENLLAQGRDITMLTNFAADTFVEAQVRFPELASSRGVTVSGEVRMIKPDPAIYRLHTATFGLEPAHTLFIDDSAANVAAARECGWQAVQFLGADRLAEDLGALGLD